MCMSALSSPGSTRALAFPDCTVAAVVVAVSQLFVGARGGGASFGLGRGAPAGVESGAGTRPAQGRLQGAGGREACWREGRTWTWLVSNESSRRKSRDFPCLPLPPQTSKQQTVHFHSSNLISKRVVFLFAFFPKQCRVTMNETQHFLQNFHVKSLTALPFKAWAFNVKKHEEVLSFVADPSTAIGQRRKT